MTLKFLCPECKKLVDEFYETFQEFPTWRVKPHITEIGKENFFYDVEYIEVEDFGDIADFMFSECPEGHMFHEWRARDFLVRIIVNLKGKYLEPIGEYWKENIEDFVEIAKELGYKPLVEQVVAVNQ